MIYPYYNFPCTKPCAGLARNLRDAGFKLPQSSLQTRKLNLNRRVLERCPYDVYIYLYMYILYIYIVYYVYIYMYVLYVIYINPIVIVANELGHHLAKILLFAKSGAPATSSAGRWDQTTLLWKSL